MAFVTQCSSCGARASVPDTAVGRTVKCPQCASLFTVAGTTAHLEPPRRSPEPYYDEPVPRPRRPAAGPDRPRGSAMGFLGFWMGFLALIVALVALGLTWFRDPLGGGLRKYNFSTPKDSLISESKLMNDRDVRAFMEIIMLKTGKEAEEKMNTLKVHKEADWNGKKILFYEFKVDGKELYKFDFFEKDAATGYWIQPFRDTFKWREDIRRDNMQLSRWLDTFPNTGKFDDGKFDDRKDINGFEKKMDRKDGFDKKMDWQEFKEKVK